MKLKVVSENKDAVATRSFRIMNAAGLATAGKVPFVDRAVPGEKSNYADSAVARFGRVNLGRGCLLAAKGDRLICKITRPGCCLEVV